MIAAFDTPIETVEGALVGPWRAPRQMLAEQSYESHASIHDDATAQKLGFKGGTIEGPTHFSQFAPLGLAIWGDLWLAEGCISAHYRSPVFEGEDVRAIVQPGDGAHRAIRMEKRDGTEVLTGTISVGPNAPPTALDRRLETLTTPGDLVILHDVAVGARTTRIPVRMDPDRHMGELYPFSLAAKLRVITEPSPLYEGEDAIIPLEMVSVLLNHVARQQPFATRGPSVGLFADQEIRLIQGPLRVSTDYEIEREVVAISGSRRTESMWVLTRVFHPGGKELLATMLLNTASMKASYARYDEEYAALHGARAER